MISFIGYQNFEKASKLFVLKNINAAVSKIKISVLAYLRELMTH
jgi:hypothetical protein